MKYEKKRCVAGIVTVACEVTRKHLPSSTALGVRAHL